MTSILFLDEVDSTNAEARRRAEAGETGPLWIGALRQTAGKGRRGRAWDSGADNLTATLLFTPRTTPPEAAQISFVAAIAVCDFVRGFLPADIVKVKWPNDVMIGDAKAAGILIESGQGPHGLWVAVGIGLNLASYPPQTERPATCLAAHMAVPAPDPRIALANLAVEFGDWQSVWEQNGFAAIADAWRARAYRMGEACVVRLPNETLEGAAMGLESDGALRLHLPGGGVRRITAGDVFFEDA
jgi:BirA family biotin operon repressor/biotin-[acetyl-CoA-carboxylase] ligase